MNSFSGRLPATSCPLPLLHLGLGPYWFVLPYSEMGKSWILGKIIIYSCISYLFVCFNFPGCFLFPGNQVHHSASYRTGKIVQDGHCRREEEVAGEGRKLYKVAKASSSSECQVIPLVHLVTTACYGYYTYIFTIMWDSLLNCPQFTPKQCECSMSAEHCCLTAVLTCFAQLWIQGRRQWKITSRVAKDVINNVCKVNLNLADVSQESLMIDCFAFLEMGG